MSRDRTEGSRKHDRNERREGAKAAEDRDRRLHSSPKAQKAQGIRDSEARDQIRELRSRYG
jgi:hypothetical protein